MTAEWFYEWPCLDLYNEMITWNNSQPIIHPLRLSQWNFIIAGRILLSKNLSFWCHKVCRDSSEKRGGGGRGETKKKSFEMWSWKSLYSTQTMPCKINYSLGRSNALHKIKGGVWTNTEIHGICWFFGREKFTCEYVCKQKN